MSTKNGTAPKFRMTREKETFRMEEMVNLDGTDVKCYVKCSVNYERLIYKVQPVITLSHDWGDDVRKTFSEIIAAGVAECKDRLAKYREETGLGTQPELFGVGEPAAGES